MKGTNAKTNFPIENYTEVMRAIKDMDIKEVIASVKREADSFSRGGQPLPWLDEGGHRFLPLGSPHRTPAGRSTCVPWTV